MDQETKRDNHGLTEKARTELFSDGVFAIVITLLVIEIHRPDAPPGGLGLALLHAWPSYLAYCLAFLYVGVIWLNHAALFDQLRYMDLGFKWINLGILGTTALMPFPTGVLAEAFQSGDGLDQRSAVVLYALIAGLMSAAWLPVFPYLARHSRLFASAASASTFGRQIVRPVVGICVYALAAILGWRANPLLAVTLFVGMLIYHATTSEGVRRKRRA